MDTAPSSSRAVTSYLVAEVRRLTERPLPDEVMEVARHCVLDWFGIALGGAREPLVEKLLEEALERGGHPECTVIWHGERVSADFAALVNASAADALDFSDANFAMRGHTTPAVVAAALALCERQHRSGLEFLTAIVAGVETECRGGLFTSRCETCRCSGT